MHTAPHNGTATSIAAAESIAASADTLRDCIHAYIAGRGDGATADEIERDLAIAGNTVRPRLIELRRGERVFDSFTTRPTRSGRKAIVWLATPFNGDN